MCSEPQLCVRKTLLLSSTFFWIVQFFLYVGIIFYFHLKMNLRNILRNHSEMWWEDEQLRALQCSNSMKKTSFSYCPCFVWDVRVDFENTARAFVKWCRSINWEYLILNLFENTPLSAFLWMLGNGVSILSPNISLVSSGFYWGRWVFKCQFLHNFEFRFINWIPV